MEKTGISGLEKGPDTTLESIQRSSPLVPKEPRLEVGQPCAQTDEFAASNFDASLGVQLFLLWDMGARMFIWSTSMGLALLVFNALEWWPSQNLFGANSLAVWKWAAAASGWVLFCNFIYLGELIFFRIVFPLPQTGVYPTNRKISLLDRRSRQLVWAAAHGVLTKARYQAPFPAFLIYHLTCLPPFRWLVNSILGPHTKSTNVSEPLLLDPAFITMGKNVVIGSGTCIAGHVQVPDMIAIRKTVIDDDVLVGANCTIFGGAHIKKGAVVAAGSVVAPYTVIGGNEYWSGVPAVKVRDFK